MNIFVEALNQKLWVKSLWAICGRSFLDIKYNFPKTKFLTSLISLRTVGAPISLEGISKLGTIWEQFA